MRPTRLCFACCASAESGHVAAAPPTNEMKSRRLIASPGRLEKVSYSSKPVQRKGSAMSALGSSLPSGGRPPHVRSGVDSGAWSGPNPTSVAGHFRTPAPHKNDRHSITSSARASRAGRRLYSITSSARASREGGIASPSVFAVFKLIANSNLVGCTTGKSEGLAPRKILAA